MLGWFDANLISILNGLAIGFLLFTMAVGLSLIFGLMDVLNLAHGALFLVGGYLAYAVVDAGGSHLGALGLALLAGLGGGMLLAVATRPLERRGHLDQALLTLGAALVIAELVYVFWGRNVQSVPPPEFLAGSASVLGHAYPVYRLAVVAVGVVLAVAVHVVVERTKLGALVRASVVDPGMVSALGVNVRSVRLGVFVLGVTLAAVGGVVGAPVLGARPGLDHEVLILGLIVVVVGGLGSVRGALVGALLIGQVQALGVALLPEYASFALFGAMALVLLLRPTGLFGDATARTA